MKRSMRGEIEFSDEPLEEDPRIGVFENNNHQTEESSDIISEDILGLADLDKVERKIPQVFNGLESFDADNLRREISAKATESLSDENQKKLADFLDNLSATQPKTLFSSSNQALILFANDPLIEQSIMAVCKHEGRFVFNAQSEDDLYRLIEQSIIRQMKPLVILNAPDEEEIRKTGKYPHQHPEQLPQCRHCTTGLSGPAELPTQSHQNRRQDRTADSTGQYRCELC